MKIGKPQGFAILTVGLIFLTGAILVFISVPNWGEWVHDYPSSIDASQLPAQAQPLAGGIKAVFGPLLEQVGGYVRAAGYFGGSMLSVISLAMMGAGLTVIETLPARLVAADSILPGGVTCVGAGFKPARGSGGGDYDHRRQHHLISKWH